MEEGCICMYNIGGNHGKRRLVWFLKEKLFSIFLLTVKVLPILLEKFLLHFYDVEHSVYSSSNAKTIAALTFYERDMPYPLQS